MTVSIQNLVEEHVQQAYSQLRTHFPDFCGCPTCKADVLVFALNRLPARYVASRSGSVITELNLEKDQSRARIDVVLMEGFKVVGQSPRCERSGTAPQVPHVAG